MSKQEEIREEKSKKRSYFDHPATREEMLADRDLSLAYSNNIKNPGSSFRRLEGVTGHRGDHNPW